jgi:hypothetical protein
MIGDLGDTNLEEMIQNMMGNIDQNDPLMA